MASQLSFLVSILLYLNVVTGQVIARNVLQEEVSDGALTTPPSRQVVSVTINGTVYELDTGVCTGGIMMKRRVPVEEFCGVGVFSTRPSGCTNDKERFIGVEYQYTCSRLMSEIQGFIRVVVEDEFTTTEELTTTTDVTTQPSTEAATINVVEINSDEVTIKPAQFITEEATIEAEASITETINSIPSTVISSTSTEKSTTSEETTTSERPATSEGTPALIVKNLELDQGPMNDSSFEHNNLIEKRSVTIKDFKEEVGNTTDVGSVSGESFSVEELVVLNKSKSDADSTAPRNETTLGTVEVTTLAKVGDESTTVMIEKAKTTTEDDFEVEFEVVKKKRESKVHGQSEEDTLPLEESSSGGLAGRSDDDGKMPGMPYDVKPVGFKTVAAAPKLKQKEKVEGDHEGKEEAGEAGNEGSEEDTVPISDDGVEIPGVDVMLAGRADDLRGGLGVEPVGFGLKVEVVDWSSEKDELGGPWLSGEEESVEAGLGVVDARGWGIEEWIEMPPPSPLFDAHSTLLRKQIDFELLKGGQHGDGGGSDDSSGFSPHVSVISEKEIQFNSTWYQILSEIAATASELIPEELFRDPFSSCQAGDDTSEMRGARNARAASKKGGKANSTAGGAGKVNDTAGGAEKPNNTSGGGGQSTTTAAPPSCCESQTASEAVIPRLPIFADLLRVFGWFTRSYESSVIVGERVLEGIKNGFKDCRQAAESWRQRLVLGDIGGCDAGVEIKSIKVDQPVWNEYNASYSTIERLLNFTSSSTDLPPMELRINAGKWIFAELLWYAVQLTYTFCFEIFSELDPNGFMMAYDVILRLFGSEMVKGLWEEVGGNLAVFELVLPFVKRSLGGGDFTRVVMELDKISGGIKAGGFVNGFGRGRRRWDEERGGRTRNSWDETGRVLRRRKRDVASVVKVVEEGDVGVTTEQVSFVEGVMSSSTPKSKLWLNVAAVSTLGTTTEENVPLLSTDEAKVITTTTTTTEAPKPPKGRVFDQTGGWFGNRLLENDTVEENIVEGIEEGEGSSSSTTVLIEKETTAGLATEASASAEKEVETETAPVAVETVEPIELVEVETEGTMSTSPPPILPETIDDDLKKYEIWGGLAYCLETEGGEEGKGAAGGILKPSIVEMVEKGGLVCERE